MGNNSGTRTNDGSGGDCFGGAVFIIITRSITTILAPIHTRNTHGT
jgi:hypothetical protein